MGKDSPRRAPDGYLTFTAVRDHLQKRGFEYELIEHLDEDGKPVMAQIDCNHRVHRGVQFSVELHHLNGMHAVKESEFNACFLPAIEAVKNRNRELQQAAELNRMASQENVATANAILSQSRFKDLRVKSAQGLMVLYHKDYPEFDLRTEFPPASRFQWVLLGRADEFTEAYLSEHRKRLADLEKSRGIAITRTPNALVLMQKELGVRMALEYVSHPIDEERWQRAASDIDSMINVNNDPETMRRRLGRLANNHGFNVESKTDENGMTTLTLSHPSAAWKTRSALLVGTQGIPGEAAMQMIAAAEKEAPRLKAPTHVKPSLPPSAIPRVLRTVKPTKIDIVVDTSVLANLECRREGGRTYLDMLRLASTLPGIQVIMPAIVAWEFSGRIPHVNGDSSQVDWEPLDPGLNKKHRADFIHEATNIVPQPDGTWHTIPGANPRLLIWHSPEQDAYFEKIANSTLGKPHKYDIINILQEIRAANRDIGEKMVLAYCQSPQSQRHAIILEDDKGFTDFRRRCNIYPRDADTHTKNGGHAISMITTVPFLYAMQEAFGNSLPELLEQHYGGKEPEINISEIVHKINEDKKQWAIAHNLDPSMHGLLRDSPNAFFRGRDQIGTLADPLNAILAAAVTDQSASTNGASLANGHANGHTTVPASPADNAETAWRERIDQQPSSQGTGRANS